jgi:hypothetical protein
MGMSTEAAIVNYHLSFADQGKQISIFCFRLQRTNGSLPFPFSVCRKNKQLMTFPLVPFSVCEIPETWRHGHRVMETWRHIHGDMETWRNRDMETWRHEDMETRSWRHVRQDMKKSGGKQKPRELSLIHSPIAHRANGTTYVVFLFVDEETNRSCLFANGLNGLAHLCLKHSSTYIFANTFIPFNLLLIIIKDF